MSLESKIEVHDGTTLMTRLHLEQGDRNVAARPARGRVSPPGLTPGTAFSRIRRQDSRRASSMRRIQRSRAWVIAWHPSPVTTSQNEPVSLTWSSSSRVS